MKKETRTIILTTAIFALCSVGTTVFFGRYVELDRTNAVPRAIVDASRILSKKLDKAREDKEAGLITLEEFDQVCTDVIQRNTALLEQLKALPSSTLPLPIREETGRPRPYPKNSAE